MTEYFYSLLQYVGLFLSLLWLVIAVVAVAKLGGKGAWLFFIGSLLGVLVQGVWVLESVSVSSGIMEEIVDPCSAITNPGGEWLSISSISSPGPPRGSECLG